MDDTSHAPRRIHSVGVTCAVGTLRPKTATELAMGSSSPAIGVGSGGGGGGSRGQLVRGSASAAGKDRARIAEMLITLEGNSREIEMQRSEIRRLREHVHQLVARTSDGADAGAAAENGGGGGGAERPHTSHAPDRGLAVSEDVPRPTSSFR